MLTALTVNDLPNLHALNSRAAGLEEIFRLLKGIKIDGETLLKLYNLGLTVANADTTKEKVVAAIEMSKILAQATPTETDDKIVAVATTVLSGKLLDLMCTLVDSWLGNVVIAQSAFESDVAAAGIDWSLYLELARQVLAIIRARREAKK